MHLADTFIQSDLQCIQAIRFLSVYVFPVNWTHNLCAANTMLPLSHRNTAVKSRHMTKHIEITFDIWELFVEITFYIWELSMNLPKSPIHA